MHEKELNLRLVRIAAFLALIASLLCNVVLYKKYKSSEVKDYRKYYGEYVRRTETAWSLENRPVGAKELNSRYPLVIELQDKVCVSLELERGAIGGVPAYCFSKTNKQVLESYDGGE